jgi:hypothetical protein
MILAEQLAHVERFPVAALALLAVLFGPAVGTYLLLTLRERKERRP